MKEILIKQNGRACEVWRNGSLVFSDGRVAAKNFALRLHASTGDALYNVKDSGSKVLVKPPTPTA